MLRGRYAAALGKAESRSRQIVFVCDDVSIMRFLACLFIAATALKLLLIPSYKSTDFEVHRNWLAITASKSHREWYHDATSVWTLDYPPLFAVFEWFLSFVARHIEPQALNISSTPYDSWTFTVFHRCSVMATDVVFLAGCWTLARAISKTTSVIGDPLLQQRLLVTIIFLNPCLMVVDHVHFQYNGMLIGLLFFVLAAALKVRRTPMLCSPHVLYLV